MMTLNALGNKYPIKETLGEIKNKDSKKAIVFLGGIHGNEPSGFTALSEVFPKIEALKDSLDGDVYAFAGNIKALELKTRFVEKDLNRIWLHKNIDLYENGEINEANAQNEWIDFIRLYKKIKEILKDGKELFVIDLHTTSAPSVPFITINDMIKNRNYSRKFPVPIILGIEEYLSGPLLSYMNEFDHVSMAFEAGQHDDEMSVKLHMSFIWASMVNGGFLRANDIHDYSDHLDLLSSSHNMSGDVFEVRYREAITREDQFKMKPNYTNFKKIHKNEVVATNTSGEVEVCEGGRIFMPLYQNEGNDGFFIIKRVPLWALALSKTLRKIRFDAVLTLLPGVSTDKNGKGRLRVNPKVAKFLTNELFHLLGYRRKEKSEDVLIFSRREIT